MRRGRNASFGAKLPAEVIAEVEEAGYKVGFADREITKWWNKRLAKRGELREFGGYFFWHRDDPNETFNGYKTPSAAYRAAYEVVRATSRALRRRGVETGLWMVMVLNADRMPTEWLLNGW